MKTLKNNPKITLGVATALIVAIAAATLGHKKAPATEVTPTATHTVELMTLDGGSSVASANFTSTPDALILHADGGGRVTRIASVGDKVKAGSIIASLENSAQSAALTSAEGAFKAAKAGRDIAALGQTPAGTGLSVAQANARTAISASYAFIDDAIRSKTDLAFTDRDSDDRRRFPIETDITYEQFVQINNERAAFNKIFSGPSISDRMQNDANLEALVREEQANLSALQRYLTDLSYVWNKANQHGALVTIDMINSQKAYILALRSSISGVQSQLAQAQSALAQAALAKDTSTKQNAAGGTSEAQIEIAQGNLDAARAAYEKTIVRAPADGRITNLSVHVGDVIAPGSNVALLAATGPIMKGASYTLPLTAIKYDATETYAFGVADGKLVKYPVETGLLTSQEISVTFIGSTTPNKIVRDVRGHSEGEVVEVK